ncbi:MAG: RNA-guided endonuclease TnpB family protein [Acidobacteriaceae bacterium]
MSGSIRGFRFRFYPTLKQRRYLSRAFGTARHVFNWGLATKKEAYAERKESIGAAQLSRMLTALKSEKPWLSEISRSIQTQALRDLDMAYQNFFQKRAKFPKFKNRYTAQSIRMQLDSRSSGKVSAWAKRVLVLPGIGECRIADSLASWPQMPAMITVRLDVCGDYWISYATESEPLAAAPEHMIGVDVGITDLAVTSDGWKSGQLTGLRDRSAQLRRYQRRVSRRVKGSKRRANAKRRLAKLHRKITDARKDFTHKVSAKITASANVIVLETLNVAGMLKNHALARSLSDVSLSELHRQIEYKAARRGSTVIRVDRFAPTSKVCSGCGHYVNEMPLSVRSWTCSSCGSEHDRDVNAALNILALGRGTALNARGDRRSEATQVASLPVAEPRIDAATRRRTDRRRVA